MIVSQHQAHKTPRTILDWFVEAWNYTSTLGVSKNDSSHFARKIELTNQVSVIIFAMVLALTGGFLATDVPTATTTWFLSMLITVWTVPFLNYLGNTSISRHVLSTAIPLFLILFTGHTRAFYPDTVHQASFYIPRFFLIGFSFLPLILFGFREKKHLFASFSVNLILLLFFNQILDAMSAGMGTIEPSVKDPFFISVSSVLALMMVSTGYFFLNKKNTEYELTIETLLDKTKKQNKNMQDAITYAKNIQQVVLPKHNVLSTLHDRLFVLYKPLHIVSGDFYLVEENDTHIVFSVIDCTGHGVPGAFMSILASSSIQRAISSVGLDEPSTILNAANRLFHEDLSRSGNPDMQDGMDMVLCSFNKKTNELKFAGANLFVHIFEDGELKEFRTDKGGISMGSPNREFEAHSINLKKGSFVYISSDGYYDQFGGEKNKKLGRRGYRELLSSLSKTKDVQKQHDKVYNYYQEWRGNSFQVDDVCLIGFKA